MSRDEVAWAHRPGGVECVTSGFARRKILGFGLACAIGLAPLPVAAHSRRKRVKSLSFYHLHTGEQLSVDYWIDGAYDREGRARIDHFFRDFRTEDVHPIDVRLLDLLHTLRIRLNTRSPYGLVSGYRSPATNEMLAKSRRGVAQRSLHLQGMAIDVHLPGRKLEELHQEAKRLRGGGVGLYRRSNFVHLDVGRVRYW